MQITFAAMDNAIRLRDLPGVAEIEAALHVPGRQILKEYDDLEERVASLSRRLFGLSWDETEFIPEPSDVDVIEYPFVPHGKEITRLNEVGERKLFEWEKHFEFLEYEFEEEGAFWAAVGWDITDGNGEPLAVMEYFGRPIVCLLKHLHPRSRLSLTGDEPIFEKSAAEAEREAQEWGRRLAEEARRFKRG